MNTLVFRQQSRRIEASLGCLLATRDGTRVEERPIFISEIEMERLPDLASPSRLPNALDCDTELPGDTVLLKKPAPEPEPCDPHSIECDVQRRLLSEPGFNFKSLVVRRVGDGVCLQGILEAEPGADVSSVAKQVRGVDRVLNRLLMKQRQ